MRNISISKVSLVAYIVIFIYVVLSLFFFSSVSPIYSIMNLQYDQHIYDLIGKGIARGLVPYIDLTDHKGIYLFLSFGIANIIGETNHIGLFIISIFYFYLNAIFTYKISYIIIKNVSEKAFRKDRFDKDTHIACLSVITTFVITYLLNTVYMSTGGIDCETTMVPFISISFYLYLRHILEEKDAYKYRSMFINGICFGIIIFIKANAALFFLAIAVMVIYETITIYKKPGDIISALLKYFASGVFGIIVATLPGIIYCIANNCLYEMYEQSFLMNIKYSGAGFTGAESKFAAFLITIGTFKEFIAISILSIPIFWYILRNKKAFIYYVISTLAFVFMVMLPLRPYYHYLTLLLFTYIPVTIFFLLAIVSLVSDKVHTKTIFIGLTTISVVILSLYTYNCNTDVAVMNGIVQQNASKKIKSIIEKKLNRKFDKKEDSKFLSIGYNLYIYEYLDILPPERNFAIPVLLPSENPEGYDYMHSYIKDAKEDFVVLSYQTKLSVNELIDFYNSLKVELNDAYECLDTFKSSQYTIQVYIKKGKI